jgi:hypothetical protein
MRNTVEKDNKDRVPNPTTKIIIDTKGNWRTIGQPNFRNSVLSQKFNLKIDNKMV